MSLEVWVELLGGCLEGQGSSLKVAISGLRIDQGLLTKNTGLNFASPHSLNKVALTAISESAR